MRRASLVLAALLVAPVAAAAHARPPRFSQIAFDPNDPRTIVLSATFGLATSEDGGASFRWTCAAAYGSDPTREDSRIALVGGATLIGTFAGLARTTDRCEFELAGGPVDGAFVTDVVADPRDPSVAWALASDGFGPDRVTRSDDGGATFRAIGDGIDAVLLERLVVAPSDPERMYVSGWRPPSGGAPRRAFVYASSDSGAHLTPVEIELEEGEFVPYVLAVDPEDADLVFVRIARGETDTAPERLLVSEDGGQTFRTAVELPAIAAAVSDGERLWVGSAAGLWALRDGSPEAEQVGDFSVTCLGLREDELWICADPRTAPFALGRMRPGGPIEPMLRMQDVTELAACPRCSRAGAQCPAWKPDLLADYAIWLEGADAGTTATGLPRDAGLPPECRPAPGCGCRTGSARPAPLALILLAFARPRRRSA